MDTKGLLEKVHRCIDSQKEQMLATLKRYINFKSVNIEQLLEGEKSELKQCQEWLYEQIKGMGYFDKVDIYELQKDGPNVAALKKGTGNGKSLMLNAHSDVVRVSEEQKKGWRVLGPWDGGVSDGKVWGRGASDMKGGGTAILYAVKAIQSLDIRLKGDLVLSYCEGEESGRAVEGIWSLLDRGFRADCAIMAEPTKFRIYHRTRGEIYFDIDLVGKSAHICNRNKTIWPQKNAAEQVGVNAIDKMLKLLEEFRELERNWGLTYYDDEIGPGTTTLAVSMIRAGESFSAQAGECRISLASMFDPKATVEEIRDQIIHSIDVVSDGDHWLKDHRPSFTHPFLPKVPINIPRDSPFVQAVGRSYRDMMGKEPFFGSGPFVGDANYLYEKGIPALYFGPGDIETVHGTNECIDVQEVFDAAKIYAAMIINWCM